GQAGGTGLRPIFVEFRVQPVLALCRLDEGKGNAGGFYLAPVDIALPFRHVDAVDGVVVWRALAEILRVLVLEFRRDGGGRNEVEVRGCARGKKRHDRQESQ